MSHLTLTHREAARDLFEGVVEGYLHTLPADHPDVQRARGNLTIALQALGEHREARALAQQVLDVYTKALPDDHPDLQWARSNLAELLWEEKDFESVRDLQEKIFDIRSHTLPYDHPDLQSVRMRLARTRAAMGEAAASQSLAREIARVESQRGQSLDSVSDRGLDEASLVGAALSIASGAGVFASDPLGEELGFEMCEAIRGATASAARLERSFRNDGEARALSLEIARTSRELNQLAGSSSARPGRFEELARQRDRRRRELLSRLEGAEVPWPDLDSAAIRNRLGPKEAAIAYWRYDRWVFDPSSQVGTSSPSYLAWVIRRAEPLHRIELGSAEAIEAAVESWRSVLDRKERRKDSAPGPAALLSKTLTRLLIAPLREAIGDATELVIAPTEAVCLVPFEALPDAQGVLGDRFSLSYRQAISELTIERPMEYGPPSLLVLGGVDYDRAEGTPGRGASESESSSEARDVAAHRSTGFSWSFDELAETGDEARRIVDTFSEAFGAPGGSAAELLTRDEATREAFEVSAPAHRYVHLATHGWFAPESIASKADDRVLDERLGLMGSSLSERVRGLAPALLCGLAFAGANGRADQYGRVRGVMTAEEIAVMNFTGVELCVLSACETSLGVRRGGRGIASLQSALHAAGVRTAITSLWKVPDEATRELMTEFYRRLWVLKEPKAKALWNAKQKIRTQFDDDGKPVYSIRDWAGWVLSGDPD